MSTVLPELNDPVSLQGCQGRNIIELRYEGRLGNYLGKGGYVGRKHVGRMKSMYK